MPCTRIGFPCGSVLGQDLGLIVRRIESDSKENEIAAELSSETPLQDAEIIGAAKTKIRQRAARINKIQHHCLPRKLRDSHGAILLVGQSELRNGITDA